MHYKYCVLFACIIIFFFLPGGDLIPSIKYKMSETPINEYSLQMNLTITNLDSNDFGGYLCIAKNALGKAEGSIRLQGILKSYSYYILYLNQDYIILCNFNVIFFFSFIQYPK